MNAANPYAPPGANVSDVLVDDELEHASRGIRFGAAILDAFLIMCAIYVPIILVGIFGYGDVGSDSAVWAILMGWLFILISLTIYLGITLYFVARDGQTLAKKWLGIKVVRGDGSKASFGRILVLRNLISWLLGLTGVYPLVDAMFIFGDQRQCLHDKMADTIVVVA